MPGLLDEIKFEEQVGSSLVMLLPDGVRDCATIDRINQLVLTFDDRRLGHPHETRLVEWLETRVAFTDVTSGRCRSLAKLISKANFMIE